MRDLKMNSDSCDCRTTQLPSGHQAVMVVLGTENLCPQLYNQFICTYMCECWLLIAQKTSWYQTNNPWWSDGGLFNDGVWSNAL